MVVIQKCNTKVQLTYGLRDQKTREEVPCGVERCGYNGCYVVVLCQPDRHHTTECEIQQCEVHEEEVPEEFSYCPLEPHHGIHYDTIYASLNQCVGELN